MEEREKKQVFISYAGKDEKLAKSICEYLEQGGIRCWFAQRNVIGGKKYGAEIARGIRECQALVLVFTENANMAEGVARELEMAYNKRMTVIPYRLEKGLLPGEDIEYFLAGFQCVEASDEDGQYNLLCAVCSALGQPAPAPVVAQPTQRVFISYARKDKALADMVCHFLEQNGVKCWVAPRDLKGGANYDKEIADGIANSGGVVVILTDNTNKAVGVEHELLTANFAQKPIIPYSFLHSQPTAKLARYIEQIHWLSADGPKAEERLLHAVKFMLQQ